MSAEKIPQTTHSLEEERQRIAHELDETLLSQIHLLLAQTQTYEQTASGQSRMAFGVISSLARQLLQQALDFQANLHSPVLETLGLASALEAFANQQRRSRGINITLSLAPQRERLPYPLELALFRAVQELVGRATNEGQASTLLIELGVTEEQVTLSILANGVPLSENHFSLIQQQIASLDGDVQLGQSRYGGLAVMLRIMQQAPIELTEREQQIIILLADGLTNKQIAAALDISPRTVKFHLDNLYSKLGVNTRTEAAIIALKQGWVQDVR